SCLMPEGPTRENQETQESPVALPPARRRSGRRTALHSLGAVTLGLSGVHAVNARDKRNQAKTEKKKKEAKPGPTGPTGPTGPAGGNANIPQLLKSVTFESSDG